MTTPPRSSNRVRMSDRKKELTPPRIPFVKPEDLAASNATFEILGYERRQNRRFGRVESAYVIRIVDNEPLADGRELPGEGLLTLEASDRREALGRIVRSLRPGQVLADVCLLKTPLPNDPTQFFYEFAERGEDGQPVRFYDEAEAEPDAAG